MIKQTMAVYFTALVLGAGAQSSQWLTTGNTGQDDDLDFLGNQDAVPMNIRTEDIRRFRLNFDESYTIGSFTGQQKHGALLLSPRVDQFHLNGAKGPYSLLHIADADNNAQQPSYRDWMHVGLTFTGNRDHGYIGQKHGEDFDFTDMVVHWSDNPTKWLKDRMRFIFTSGYNDQVATGANSLEGLEAMRLYPVDDDNVNIGLGDFYAGNYTDPSNVLEPTERLDVLNGRVRIRQLPTDAEDETLDKYMVVDDDGVVHWRPLPTSATTGCEWELLSGNRLVTGYQNPGTNGSCPDRRWRLGIGTANPNYKVEVVHSEDDEPMAGGISLDLRTNSNSWRGGIYSSVQPVDASASLTYATSVFGLLGNLGLSSSGTCGGIAVLGRALTDQPRYITNSVGVGGDAVASNGNIVSLQGGAFSSRGTGGTMFEGIGAYCSVSQHISQGSMTRAFGVYAEASNATTNYALYGYSPGSADWAGYFVGRSFTTAGVWTPSDGNLKANAEPITTAMERLSQLSPKTYVFNHSSYPHMGLPQETQYGFMAQELAEVFPEFVTDAVHPAMTDSLGTELHPAVEFKAVNLGGLTPVIVAAMKEQQVLIADLRAELTQLRAEVQSCCANPDGSRMQAPTNTTEPALDDRGDDRKLRIVPNPFNESTTVYYNLERGGRTQLMANSADGRELRVLQEANLAAGDYQFQWNTASLAPGTYYVTLLLDGQPVVKKGVKVAR